MLSKKNTKEENLSFETQENIPITNNYLDSIPNLNKENKNYQNEIFTKVNII